MTAGIHPKENNRVINVQVFHDESAFCFSNLRNSLICRGPYAKTQTVFKEQRLFFFLLNLCLCLFKNL